MEAMRKLDEHLKGRIAELGRLRQAGRRIIGYTPGAYLPEELIHACGAIPIQLIRGGDPEPVAESTAYHVRWFDTFCRSQIVYRLSGEEPLYNMVDLLIAQCTDHNMRAIGNSWKLYTDTEVFKFGVPHSKEQLALDYYRDSLGALKSKLEEYTGTAIDDARLRDAIAAQNRMRALLKELSLMRKSEAVPLSSRDFVRLHHASFYADRDVMLDVLESLAAELKAEEPVGSTEPRILFTGSTLAMGDSKVFDLMEEAGGRIVIEHFDEGLRDYWENVESEGDPMEALAYRYFMRQVPAAWFRPSRERLDFIVQLARDFKVDGILWYQLLYRDGIEIQSSRLPLILKRELDIPMLKLQSDWDREEKNYFRTRAETFVGMLEGREAAHRVP